jgi:hypothetical protein
LKKKIKIFQKKGSKNCIKKSDVFALFKIFPKNKIKHHFEPFGHNNEKKYGINLTHMKKNYITKKIYSENYFFINQNCTS